MSNFSDTGTGFFQPQVDHLRRVKGSVCLKLFQSSYTVFGSLSRRPARSLNIVRLFIWETGFLVMELRLAQRNSSKQSLDDRLLYLPMVLQHHQWLPWQHLLIVLVFGSFNAFETVLTTVLPAPTAPFQRVVAPPT